MYRFYEVPHGELCLIHISIGFVRPIVDGVQTSV